MAESVAASAKLFNLPWPYYRSGMSDAIDYERIFFPHVTREMERVRAAPGRFAHYTSADAALKILRSEKMLLRNSTLMNDFSEVRHGLECLRAAYNNSADGRRLTDLLNQIDVGLAEKLEAEFNGQIDHLVNETYLISVSEHLGGDEDFYGRLSMWRAYAPKDGVAFVFHSTPFVSESNSLNAFSSPVLYAQPSQFQPAFRELVDAIEGNFDHVKALGVDGVHSALMAAFRFAIQSTKHPAFKEELEWRVIYAPTLLPQTPEILERQIERVPTEIMSLGGVPQRVYSIPFKDYPEEGFCGASVPDLLDFILIGPSQDAHAIQQALIGELLRLGVPEPGLKVRITGIPLRT